MSRTCIVTGASGSMGAEAVRSLVSAGDRVIMACRNAVKADAVRKEIIKGNPSSEIEIAELDLSSLVSVRRFAESLSGEKVDALFNNAGVINRDYKLTEDGYENTLSTNYLGPCLLTRLLLPSMPSGSHIVNMVSLTCRFGSVDRTFFSRGEERFSQLGTYSDTKLAFLLFSVALGSRVSDIYVNVADPGIVNSNMIAMGRWFDFLADLFFRPLCKKPADGVAPALKALETDTFLHCYKGKGHRPIAARYFSHPSLEWLWEETERIIGRWSLIPPV